MNRDGADMTSDPVDTVIVARPNGAQRRATSFSAAETEDTRLLFSKRATVHTERNRSFKGFVCIVQRWPSTYLLSWVPDSVLEEHDELEAFLHVEISDDGTAEARVWPMEDSVIVTPQPRSGPDHAFCIPISSVYSLILQPPTITSWVGSVTVNDVSGASLPTIYFDDEDSASTVFSRDRRARLVKTGAQTTLPSGWGGEALVQRLRTYATVVKSSLDPSVFLVNPSRADLEAHSTPMFGDDEILPPHLRPQRLTRSGSPRAPAGPSSATTAGRSILHQAMSRQTAPNGAAEARPAMDELTFSVLSSFSKLTRNARSAVQQFAQPVLSHRLAQPILPHLPPPIANLAVQPKPPDWAGARFEEASGGYDAARVYLAKWARIVAEEGERARRAEVGASADGEEASALGAFEVLARTYQIQRPRTTRAIDQPIVESELLAWFDPDGRLLLSEAEAKRRIFQRGLTNDARTHAWLFLLRVVPWESTASEREQVLKTKREEYARLKSEWQDDEALRATDAWQEEDRRIEVDCRRTDRTHSMFSLPEDQDLSTAASRLDIGGQAPSNEHVRRLEDVLRTYNQYEKELGYVQGMSDLCSPIYVTLKADEALVFWCFVEWMNRQKDNFLRDQSGMKRQLSLLQSLIALMDPALHRHLVDTDAINLFMCFRWLLVAFKREFGLEATVEIWENCWCDLYGRNFLLFFALAILEANRDVILRYLTSFDEVLKFCVDLSGTIEAGPMLCQAEILALQFRDIVSIADKRIKDAEACGAPIPPDAVLDPSLRELLM